MTAADRLAKALREAAAAVEELYGDKPKKRRRRGLLPLDDATEIPANVQQQVDHRLAANGYRRR